ncbi:MAG TPA: carboxylating nicotinate-nucleotide diphosphorylase [Rhodothermales bacterium]
MIGLPPYLTAADIDAIVRRALAEDVGSGDVTTLATVHPGVHAEAELVAKASGILAGTPVFDAVFRQLDPTVHVTWLRADGDAVAPGDRIATLAGPARAILSGERTALNLLQRMSGVASATHAMVQAVRPHHARILDTRKTAPGLRLLDKWAVLIGGGQNHRIGLFDMILIKENHITAAGSVEEALHAARMWVDRNRPVRIEIEARTLDEVRQVLEVGVAELVLLDNMARRTPAGLDTSMLSEAVRLVSGRIQTEASGNVSLDTVHAIAATGVDFISAGELTHSVKALDVSLLVGLGRSA